MEKDFRCELISWRWVYLLARKLAYMINGDNFQLDVIVAIARRGSVPARILCDFLDINTLASIRIRSNCCEFGLCKLPPHNSFPGTYVGNSEDCKS